MTILERVKEVRYIRDSMPFILIMLGDIKMKVTVCIGSSCHVKGSHQVVEKLKKVGYSAINAIKICLLSKIKCCFANIYFL